MSNKLKSILCSIIVLVVVFSAPLGTYAKETSGSAIINTIDVPSSDYTPGFSEFFCRETLTTSEERRFYSALVSVLSNCPAEELTTEFSVSVVFRNVKSIPLTSDEILKVIYCVFDDHPELFWFFQASYATDYNFILKTFTVFITVDSSSVYSSDEELVADAKAFSDSVNNIISKTENLSVFEQIQYLDRWLCFNCKYNYDAAETGVLTRAHLAVSALVDGNVNGKGPVCKGYAMAFKYLCDRLGVPCIIVLGNAYVSETSYGAHAWNYVMFEDSWYAVDVTWNDSLINKRHFMVGSDTVTLPYCGTSSLDQFGENHIVNLDYLLALYYPELSQNGYYESTYKLQPLPEYENIYISEGYVYGISERQCVGDVIPMFMYSDNVRIYYDGNDLANSEKVCTGYLMYIFDSRYNYTMLETAEVVIKGDVNGDGKVTTTDYILIKKDFYGQVNLSGAYFRAADIDDNGVISTTDYIKVKKYFNKLYDLYN